MATRRPTAGQHCRRSCRPSTALRWHGFGSTAIPNPICRETKLLMHKFWGAQCGDYADCYILVCDAVQCGINLARFRNKLLPLSSRRWNSWEQKVLFTLEWPYTEGTRLYCDCHLLCILYCGCFNLFCNVCVCVCACFDNCVVVLVICILVFSVFCIVSTMFVIVSFMYMYSYLCCLYDCKDYCHRVTTQLQ
jgi:hypothetical protein